MSLAAMDAFPEPEREPHHNASFPFIDQPWVDDALCAQTDPEIFHPEKGGSTRQAKAVCAQCFVQAECLDYAMTNDERFGIWGGLSERERRTLKSTTAHEQRQKKPPPHGTDARHKAHHRAGETPCRPCLDAHKLARQLLKETAERTAS